MGSVNAVGDAIEGHRGRTEGSIDRALSGGERTVEECFDCGRDPEATRSCTTETITFPDGVRESAVRYGERTVGPNRSRCPGCGVRVLGFHHPFCPLEPCPRCGGRLAACACLDADKTR